MEKFKDIEHVLAFYWLRLRLIKKIEDDALYSINHKVHHSMQNLKRHLLITNNHLNQKA